MRAAQINVRRGFRQRMQCKLTRRTQEAATDERRDAVKLMSAGKLSDNEVQIMGGENLQRPKPSWLMVQDWREQRQSDEGRNQRMRCEREIEDWRRGPTVLGLTRLVMERQTGRTTYETNPRTAGKLIDSLNDGQSALRVTKPASSSCSPRNQRIGETYKTRSQGDRRAAEGW